MPLSKADGARSNRLSPVLRRKSIEQHDDRISYIAKHYTFLIEDNTHLRHSLNTQRLGARPSLVTVAAS
jgi:hypothetical protein